MNKNRNLLIALGAALVLCLCAAAVAFLVMRELGTRMADSIKTGEAEAAEVGEKIAGYDVPDGYEEQSAMDLLFYRFVVIAPPGSQPGMMIMLMQFEQGQSELERQNLEEQMRRSFEQQSGRSGLDMRVVEVRQMVIRGEEVEVVVSEGSDESGFMFHQWLTVFPARSGTGMVMIQGADEFWDEAVAEDFMKSIR